MMRKMLSSRGNVDFDDDDQQEEEMFVEDDDEEEEEEEEEDEAPFGSAEWSTSSMVRMSSAK
mgnify:CR=1 FL=1